MCFFRRRKRAIIVVYENERGCMERISNKLVRDNIPNIIKENGEVPITRILTDEEYKKELEKKVR